MNYQKFEMKMKGVIKLKLPKQSAQTPRGENINHNSPTKPAKAKRPLEEEKGGSSKRNKISETVHSSRNSKSPDVDIQEELRKIECEKKRLGEMYGALGERPQHATDTRMANQFEGAMRLGADATRNAASPPPSKTDAPLNEMVKDLVKEIAELKEMVSGICSEKNDLRRGAQVLPAINEEEPSLEEGEIRL